MNKLESEVSEIITVPSSRFMKGTEFMTKTNLKRTENNAVNNTSHYEEQIDHGRKHGRALSCDSEVRIHKTFAHTSGTNDALVVNKEEIKDLIVDLLRCNLGSLRYDHKQCSQKCLKLSEIIESCVRKKCSRCKIVSTVLIGALREKGPAMAIQSLYSERSDCIALAYYGNQSLFASAAVFVVRL